jgi:putative membrane protein
MFDDSWERLPLLSVAHQTWIFTLRILKDVGLTIWLWVSLFIILKSIPLVILAMVSIVAGTGLLVSLARWYFYRFRFTQDAVEIQEGIFSRVNKKIPFANVINVEINRPFIFRMTSYVEAIFDSAGHSSKDGLIPCIERSRAEEVKSRLMLQPADDVKGSMEIAKSVLVERSALDLFIFGMAHNRVFLFLGLLVGLYYKVKEVVKDLDSKLLVLYHSTLDSMHPAAITIVGVIVLLIASSVMSGLIQVVKSYKYKLWQDGNRLTQIEGLVTNRESHVTMEKLQRIVIRRTMLDRLVGRCSVELVQLNGAMTVPALRPREALALCSSLNVNMPNGPLHRGAFYSAIKWSLFALAPLLFLAYQALILDKMSFFISFVLIGCAGVIFSIFRWYRFGFAVDEKSILVKTGRMDERVFIAELLKCQAVTISQSWIERSFGLASVRVHFVMKTLVLKGVPQVSALALRDRCLLEIESSKRWF